MNNINSIPKLVTGSSRPKSLVQQQTNSDLGLLKYFSSFGGYDEPPVPKGEIAFADTATVPTFYLGWFGDSGRLTRFQKIAVMRRQIRRFILAEWTQPQSKVYFAVEDLSDKPIGWHPVEYNATECLSEYYDGHVDSTGLGGEAVRFERLIAFTQNYDSDLPALNGHRVLAATEKPGIESTKQMAEATANLLKAVENFDNIALRVGKLIVVKLTDENGKSQVFVETISLSLQHQLEANPRILRNPQAVSDFLQLREEQTAPYYDAKLEPSIMPL
jgi:hypothetical protein